MGSFSIWHWLIVLVVVLVLFGGGGKISQLMGDFGKGLKSFKKGMKEEEEPAPDEEKKTVSMNPPPPPIGQTTPPPASPTGTQTTHAPVTQPAHPGDKSTGT